MTTAAVISTIVGAILGLVFLICVLPFRIRAKAAAHDGEVSGSARVDWAFGLIAVGIAPSSGAMVYFLGLPVWRLRRRRHAAERDRASNAEKPPESKGRAGLLRRLIAFRRHRSQLVDMLGRMAETVRLDMVVSGTVGTGDPANNAWVLLAMRAAQELPGVRLGVGVDWLEEALDVDIEASARVWLVHALVEAVLLLASRENRSALRAIA